MKRLLMISLGAISTVATLTITSCESNKCKAIVCANGAVCEEDGSCTCPVGYEGERCETATRDRYRGAWTVDETGTVSGVARYTVSVENGPAINQIQIRNFNNLNNTSVVIATVTPDSVFIAPQTFEVAGVQKTVVGYGVIEPAKFYGAHGEIRMYYRVSSSDGVTDDYGYRESGQPSVWIK